MATRWHNEDATFTKEPTCPAASKFHTAGKKRRAKRLCMRQATVTDRDPPLHQPNLSPRLLRAQWIPAVEGLSASNGSDMSCFWWKPNRAIQPASSSSKNGKNKWGSLRRPPLAALSLLLARGMWHSCTKGGNEARDNKWMTWLINKKQYRYERRLSDYCYKVHRWWTTEGYLSPYAITVISNYQPPAATFNQIKEMIHFSMWATVGCRRLIE